MTIYQGIIEGNDNFMFISRNHTFPFHGHFPDNSFFSFFWGGGWFCEKNGSHNMTALTVINHFLVIMRCVKKGLLCITHITYYTFSCMSKSG